MNAWPSQHWRWLALGFVACSLAHADDVATADRSLTVIDTQADAPPLTTPAQAVALMSPPPDFRVHLVAAEPDVRQPIAMTTDARGRLWVAENYTYAEPNLITDDRHRDRIIVLEDTDGDGRSDQRRVFWDQARCLTSIEMGRQGVWALCPPQLLFLPDRDGDDRFDGEPIVVLDGFDFGPANHHNFANGLKWGPDGWLYGRNGITNVGHVGTLDTPVAQRVDIGPGIWRFHPTTRRIEMVCTGTTNPWGHDWDEHGELFFINTVIGHLWHAVPNAHLQRMFGADSNPYVYALIEQTADHFHWDTMEPWQAARKSVSHTTDAAGGGHAHAGLLIYQGDNWPKDYRGQMLTINLHGRRLNRDRLERDGASYVGRHEADLFPTRDPWFRGIDLMLSPQGDVLLADWSDVGECHEHDGVHRSSGRILRLRYQPEGVTARDASAKSLAIEDLGQLHNDQLVSLTSHPNEWYVRTSRRILRERFEAGIDVSAARERWMAIATGSEPDVIMLRALWGLHGTGGVPHACLKNQLAHSSEHVRAWAVRLFVDQTPDTLAVAPEFIELAQHDRSGLVLLYLASSLPKMPTESAWRVAAALAQRTEFADDRVYPKLLWYGIEPLVARDRPRAVELAVTASIPFVRRAIARRVTTDLAAEPAAVESLVQAIERSSDPRDLLYGMSDALQGWRQAPAPPSWSRAGAQLLQANDEGIRSVARELSVVFGDGRAIAALRDIARSKSNDLDARRAAIDSLARSEAPDLLPLFTAMLSEHDLAPAAVRGIAQLNVPDAYKPLLEHFGKLYPPGREAALVVLTERPAWARQLMEEIEQGRIPATHVTLSQIRQMQSYRDDRLQELLKKWWPELRPLSADKKARIEEIAKLLATTDDRPADRVAGRVVWENQCARCHTLFGHGGKIGPDLTGAQRSNREYLLENVIDPSANLAAQFRMTNVELHDGRTLQGVVLTKTNVIWELQTPTDRITLPATDIDAAHESTISLMPEGLVDLLQPQQIRDLFAYLQSAEQVGLPTDEKGP